MMVNRILLIAVTAVMMITLLVFNVHPFIAGSITILTMVVGYVIIGHLRVKKRLSLLDDACDPEAFMERTEKQKEIMRKNLKMNAYFDIDLSAGLITLGRFEEAKALLLSINKSHLSRKNDSLLIYTLNLMLCYYALDEVALAEALFETQIPVLSPINPRIVQAMNVLVAERFFYLKRYQESQEHLSMLLSKKLSKRAGLGILFLLAQIDQENGNLELANEKYLKVANEGNKLWIAEMAKKKLALSGV